MLQNGAYSGANIIIIGRRKVFSAPTAAVTLHNARSKRINKSRAQS
ncbi:hypothetical protein [Polycyclovorans algicola]|nr:hypothetical protein [Polycyclovorans algicola]